MIVHDWFEAPGRIVQITSENPGTNLLILGCVHGNETCGREAIERIVEEFQDGRLEVIAGSVTFIPVTNVAAYEQSSRFVDRDLNRNFVKRDNPQNNEDIITNSLADVLVEKDVLLDLHSHRFVGGPSFVFLGPENNTGPVEPFAQGDKELRFAMQMGLQTCVFGWFSAYDAFVRRQHVFLDTLGDVANVAERADVKLGSGVMEYFRKLGGYGITVECGHHDDPSAVNVADRAIRNALVSCGIVAGQANPLPFENFYKITDVLLRENPEDQFAQDWKVFQPVKAGEPIGMRSSGEVVRAKADGAIIFAYPDAEVGGPWAYIAEDSHRSDGNMVNN